MADEPNKEGRPAKTPEEIKEEKTNIVRKLEPYLKGGLSVNKALGEAQISRHVFYDYLGKDEQFRDTINGFRNFVPILLNNILVRELMSVSEKQNGNPAKKKPPQKLSKEDIKFLEWFALNSNLTKGEFGERKTVELFDPEAEIQKVKGLIDESTSEDISHDNE